MNLKKRLQTGFLAALTAAIIAFFVFVPGYVERQQNKVIAFALPDNIDSRHRRLYVADLHTDSLLWQRDLSTQSRRGHVDLPRLRTGNVALQVFSAVTKSPAGLNYLENDATARDNVTLLAIAQRWPIASWSSLYVRARYQLQKLQKLADQHPNELMLIRSQNDLQTHRERRESGEKVVGALYLIEGAHPLEGNLENLRKLSENGLRIVGLTHFFDNEVADSLHGKRRGGLTPFGRRVIEFANQHQLIIDIAHASPLAVEQALSLVSGPMLLSHGGMRGNCDSPRNLDDSLMQRFAAAGGLLGIGFWNGAVCDSTPQGIADAVVYAANTLGIEHVALGSDFDGAVTTRFDVARLDLITSALFERGLDEREVAAVMGENAYRFFADNLPEH